ncbi:response regulator transcription factor [Enterococcus faecium]|uniref:response regulator transcription factor n=1 Tax=Enterococcus faecium TaxID=1352 RepID=UPI000BBCE8A5|nr:response regulator transcription factor [Enterococcus faecium]EGO9279668.1 DNA-binding response regulator [Enterococcus faecalis]EGP5119591.1 response regulator transcription factor [Enterococcus faecium]NTQ82952.1 response regulator transcription factor [Enterococcus faecium]PCE10997.1 DNA-binding response regulator [Enterococcus faecium]HAQ0425784.1 response regulator transcription factor [Enterococcus faecium]
MTTLFLAEDQIMLNTTLTTILNLEDDFDVIASAADGKEALDKIRKLQPEVVILDIEMPRLTGLEVAKEIRSAGLPIKIIILTTFARECYFQEAVEYNVDAYLLKDSPSDYLIASIHQILTGNRVFSPELVTSVLRAEKNPLTKREMSVLAGLQTGASTAKMAEELFLSEGTLRNYISSILSKTGTHSRIEAINIAKKNGWIA